MSRQLLLLRHAKSDWSIDNSDFDRPLKNRGKRAAQRMGAWMRQQLLIPDYIISSPAERARTTAEKLCKAMGLTTRQIHFDNRLYASSSKDLKAVLSTCPKDAKKVLLIGHNPGLEELLQQLHKGRLTRPDDDKLLPTATLAVIDMPNNWHNLSNHCAKVISITRPSSLDKNFPFNGLTGLELRKRPAYYYSQSAAIPYRVVNKQLEVLVISSSGNNHWGVPKGIIEPGYTASASAAIEAWEEAGIKGIISEQMLDYYQYQKWGGTCTVQVFPMTVTDMVGDSEWEENHRSREWLPLKKASSLIKQQALQTTLLKLDTIVTNRTT
ncbi:MAG: histidine phosphatase family protein [Methylococcales bacterium]